MELTRRQALGLRMSSLLLSSRRAAGVAEVVTWLGAMQAQDLASGLWSFGARLPGHTAADVIAALERREAVRTWPMRGTIHFVPARDARWMLDLMAVRMLNGAARARERLGLSEQNVAEAMDALGAALAGGGRLSRSECLDVLARAGIDAGGSRGYHLLCHAAQRGLVCIAPNLGNEQSFVLLDEWVPDPHLPERDEALGLIALRYFRGRGPTTRQDFAGWTGLTAADTKRAIAVAGNALTRATVDGTETYLATELLDAPPGSASPEPTPLNPPQPDNALPHPTPPGAALPSITPPDTALLDTTPPATALLNTPRADSALLHSAPDSAPAGGGAPTPTPASGGGEVLVLPGFDEYLLGYKDRSLMVADEHKTAIIPGGNGVFQPTVVRDGQVVATWKRAVSKSKVKISVQPLVPLGGSDRAEAERAFERYAWFLGVMPEVRWW